MPTRAKRPCAWQGCGQLVDGGYCRTHQSKADTRHRQEQADDPLRPYYHCKRWTTTRLVVLGRDPICMACGNTASTVVHHVVDARVWVAQGNDFYDETNLVGLCKPCHDSHTATTSGFAAAI